MPDLGHCRAGAGLGSVRWAEPDPGAVAGSGRLLPRPGSVVTREAGRVRPGLLIFQEKLQVWVYGGLLL